MKPRHILISLLLLIFTGAAEGAVMYSVSFDDPGGAFAPFYSSITSSFLSAGQEWSQFLVGTGTIDTVISFNPSIPTADSASAIFVPTGTVGPRTLVEQGAANEIRTGMDPNGAAADARLRIGTNYLTNQLFFGAGPIPSNKTDAESVFLHELGHIFAFNGPNDVNFTSTFGQYVVFDGANPFFAGPAATALYGDEVPLTLGNDFHLGNLAPGPGADLIPDLMNGVSFDQGRRYEILRARPSHRARRWNRGGGGRPGARDSPSPRNGCARPRWGRLASGTVTPSPSRAGRLPVAGARFAVSHALRLPIEGTLRQTPADLTESMRGHLYSCAMLPEQLR